MAALSMKADASALLPNNADGLKKLLSLAYEGMNALRIDLADIEQAHLSVTTEIQKLHADDVSASVENDPACERIRALRATLLSLDSAGEAAQRRFVSVETQTQKLELLINRSALS